MRMPHTGCPRGKRVRIVLRNGERVEGRFRTRTDRWVELYDGTRIAKDNIRSFFVLRHVDQRKGVNQ